MTTSRLRGRIVILVATLFFTATIAAAGDILKPETGNVIFVSKTTGSNKNPGSRTEPLKNLDKAIKIAVSGDTIAIAEGVYSGTFDIGYFESDKALKIYGGFSTDFSKRHPTTHQTLLQPDNKSGAKSRKPILRFSKDIDGLVIDGLVIDMGERNSYHPTEGKPEGMDGGMLLLPPKKASGDNATVTEACLSIPSAAQGGEVVIRNNVFLNGAKFGIQAGLRSGAIHVLNNVFVSNRMAAIEIYGTCPSTGGPKSMSRCGLAEIANNTILFSWSRTKDFQDMGYGVRVMTKLGYDIHHNIIAGNIMAGVDDSRFTPDEWIQLDENIFFVNKMADLEYSPESNTTLDLWADQFEDLEFGSVSNNSNAVQKGLSIEKAYLEGFLSARYSEETDFDPESPANQWRSVLGMNLQGKMSSSVSMYANHYPVDEALKLFGAVKGIGAQGL